MARLVVNREEADLVTHELTRDIVTIGSAPFNHIVIDDPAVSAQHAILARVADSYRLKDMNSGKVMGRTTFERWGVVTPTQDKLRHVALDVTAAVVAGNGSRERIVNPLHKVYTVADRKKGKAAYVTMTLEHDVAFVLSSDTHERSL